MNSLKNQTSSNYNSLRKPKNVSAIAQPGKYAQHDSTTMPRNSDVKYQNLYSNYKPQNTYNPQNTYKPQNTYTPQKYDKNMFSNTTYGADKYDLS